MKTTDIFLNDSDDSGRLDVTTAIHKDGVVVIEQGPADTIVLTHPQALEMAHAIIREHALRTVKYETRGSKEFEESMYTLNEGDYWNQVKVTIDSEYAGLYVAGSSKSGAGVKEYLSKLKVVLNAIKEL